MRQYLLAILFAAFPLTAQSPAQQASATDPSFYVHRATKLHKQAETAAQAEALRARRATFCSAQVTTLDLASCLKRELDLTQSNYHSLVMAIGALLRAPDAHAATPIPFDTAETTWHTYRDQACTAAAAENEGGTIHPIVVLGCEITLTHHHIDELWQLYKDEGTR